MAKFVLHYTDEVTYEIEAENKELAIEKADELWANRIPRVIDEGEKTWEQQERTISLTNAQWGRLTTFLLMSTQYREGELEAWEKLATEKNDDGTPTFKNAENNAAFWRGMIEDIAEIRESIDGVRLESTISRATARAQEINSGASKESYEVTKE